MTRIVHKVGMYNVEFGHPVDAHVAMILKRFDAEKLKVLGIGEAQDYTRALRKAIKAAGHTLITSDENRQRNALLVRAGAKIGRTGWFQTPGHWFNPEGHKMEPTETVWAVVDGVRHVYVHAPVHAWVTGPHGRTFTGPELRLEAYINFIRGHAQFAHRHPKKPLNIMGDWNASPDTKGKFSPNDLRERINGEFARPGESTGHGEIDFAIVRGLRPARVTALPNLKEHADHRLVTMDLVEVKA